MKRETVIFSDTQSPYHLPQCIALGQAYNARRKPHTVIFNGDMVDFASISQFSKLGRLTPSRVKDECLITREEVLKPLTYANSKVRYYIEGNHEARLKKYVWTMAPGLEELIAFRDVMGLNELGLKYVEGRGSSGNGILRLTPKLTVMHGERHGMNPARLTVMDVLGSVIMGHAHKESSFRITSSVTGNDFLGLASGCMCQEPLWRSMSNYNRGFIGGWYDDETGHFSFDHMRITGDDFTTLVAPWFELRARLDAKTKRWCVSETGREGKAVREAR